MKFNLDVPYTCSFNNLPVGLQLLFWILVLVIATTLIAYILVSYYTRKSKLVIKTTTSLNKEEIYRGALLKIRKIRRDKLIPEHESDEIYSICEDMLRI